MSYASNAFFALSAGFGFATAATFSIRQLRVANGITAVACVLCAATLHALSRNSESPSPKNPELETSSSTPSTDFSIIIPVYNRPQFVQTLLARLSAQTESWTDLGSGEIVIVDDGSVDETGKVAEQLARLMPIPTRVLTIAHAGPGAARNAGFAAARGVIGVSIDSDCLPDEGWLPGLLEPVRSDSKTIAFAQIHAARRFAYPIENAPDREGFISASFAMDRASFCSLGGFYEEYGMSHEDIDFVQVARNAGYRIIRADSTIKHPLRMETAETIWSVGLNSKYANLFARRHGKRAHGLTKTTPYYFFGIYGNYGSSISMLVAAANLVLIFFFTLTSKSFAARELPRVGTLSAKVAALYVLALAALGLIVGAGVRRLPQYIATLASFQVSTALGRLEGSLTYGVALL